MSIDWVANDERLFFATDRESGSDIDSVDTREKCWGSDAVKVKGDGASSSAKREEGEVTDLGLPQESYLNLKLRLKSDTKSSFRLLSLECLFETCWYSDSETSSSEIMTLVFFALVRALTGSVGEAELFKDAKLV